MLNLNVGAGTNRKQDYISVDLYSFAADEDWDITKTWPYGDGSVDNIYASHVIEHLSRAELKRFCHEVQRCLKPEGSIEIYCPDILKVCQEYINDPHNPYAMMQLYGLQSTPGEFHKNGIRPDYLKEMFSSLRPEELPPTDNTEIHMRFTK